MLVKIYKYIYMLLISCKYIYSSGGDNGGADDGGG